MAPPSELTPLQEKASGILGNTPIDGIEGGLEVCGNTSSSSMSSSLSSCRDAYNTDHPEMAETSSPLAVETPSRPMKRLRFTGKEDYEERLLKIEGQKLEVQRERLRIETERLDVERQRLAIERQRLLIEQQRHTVYLAQRGVTFEVTEN
eukprot:XP_011423471.1 PREDICTED: uncharacterized protein LOC105325550 [Crassostrea gigas]